MSSESSTEPQLAFRAFHFFVVAGLLAATAAVLLAQDTSPQNLLLISVAVATAAGVGIAGYRTLAPLVAPLDADAAHVPHQRRREALEREKSLVLRSIKDLEFDRAMGKVSELDFEDMAGRLRARAIGLMRQLDEWDSGEYRVLIARELEARLGISIPPFGAERPQESEVAPSAGEAVASVADITCPACDTAVSPGDAFCRRCGARLSSSRQS